MTSSSGSSGVVATATPDRDADARARPSRRRSSDETARRTRSPTSTAISGRRVAQQHGELLAAEPGRDVVLADGLGDRPRDLAQHVVADGVPERVVELLEAVDVDHQDADPVLGPAPLGEQPEVLVEVAAVGQAGQRVGRGAGLGLAQRVDARQRRRRLGRGRLEDPVGARRPRLARAARHDDRALDLAVDAERRGEHVATARRRRDTRVGDPVRDPLVGARRAAGVACERPPRAHAAQGRDAGAAAGRLELGHASPSRPRRRTGRAGRRRSRAGRAAGRRPDRARSATAVSRRPRERRDREARRARRPRPGPRARAGAARCARSGRRAASSDSTASRTRASGRRRTTATWSAPVPAPSSSTIAATIASGETDRRQRAQDPGERLGLGATGALDVGDRLALADGQQRRRGRRARGRRGRRAAGRGPGAAARWCRGRRR